MTPGPLPPPAPGADAATRAARAAVRREVHSPALTPLERTAFARYAAAKRSREVWEPLWQSWMD